MMSAPMMSAPMSTVGSFQRQPIWKTPEIKYDLPGFVGK
jgi:hypothetical protein